MVACSGGADSTALVLALSGASRDLVVAHVIHDMRPRDEAMADAREVESLARRLGLEFVLGEARRTPGNAEARARTARYRVLAELAERSGAGFVATAHHADDQLETVVMALLRGAGPRGLGGMAPARPITPGSHVVLIRPMLSVTRAQARALCLDLGTIWREDATNADTTRLRAALRAGPLAQLVALRPGSPARAARSARLCRDAVDLINRHAASVMAPPGPWDRALLRVLPDVVLGAGLRAGVRFYLGTRCADRLTGALLDPAISAIRDRSTRVRRFDWPGGLRLEVAARRVSLDRAPAD